MKGVFPGGGVLLAIVAASTSAAGQTARPVAAPSAVVAAERAHAGADVLLPLARSQDVATAAVAIRALGRLQDRALIDTLLDFQDADSPPVRHAAAAALAQTLVTATARADGALIARVVDRMLEREEWQAAALLAMPDVQHASAVEALIASVLTRAERGTSGDGEAAARAFESLARRNARLTGFALRPDSVALLEEALAAPGTKADAAVRRYAVWTLVQAHAASGRTLKIALHDPDEQTRRIAVQAMGADDARVEPGERLADLASALKDPSILVRVEAVRSYAKAAPAGGDCSPLIEALRDAAGHVVNTTLDALATACRGNDRVTARLARDAVVPPAHGPWQRSAHALVALAARDGARVQALLPGFAAHPVWEVRMYAARAAELLKDEATLARLAMDASDNVRSAALPPLHKMSAGRARAAVVAALGRTDTQLLRTAATLLAGEPAAPETAAPLSAALQRMSRERRQTTRDARLPLLDALAKHGSAADTDSLVPLLTDVDPRVAERAAAILRQWGRSAQAAPEPPRRAGELPPFGAGSACVAMQMASGRRMRLRMDADAPVTSDAFLRLALDRHFYDGRTFHRVEPNFVIQGGAPGANEYSSGLDAFLRDEIGVANLRGGVGLSTRGLDTADGQIYVLLVDEPRLDGRYTIFAHVFDTAEDMRTLDGIQEGDEIRRVTRTPCGPRR